MTEPAAGAEVLAGVVALETEAALAVMLEPAFVVKLCTA